MPRPSITLSHDLLEAATLLARKRKYRGLSELIQAYIRYDALTQREHVFTTEWAAMSPAERDMLDQRTLAKVKAGQPARGSWFDSRLEIILNIVLGFIDRGHRPTVKEVAEEFAKHPEPPPPRLD